MKNEQLKQYLKDTKNYLNQLANSPAVAPERITINSLIAVLACNYTFDTLMTNYVRNERNPMLIITRVHAADYFCLGTMLAILIGTVISSGEYRNIMKRTCYDDLELKEAKKQMQLSRKKLFEKNK